MWASVLAHECVSVHVGSDREKVCARGGEEVDVGAYQ